jgi:hypothetical protein
VAGEEQEMSNTEFAFLQQQYKKLEEKCEKAHEELRELVLSVRELLKYNPDRQPDEWYMATCVLANKVEPFKNIK